MTTKRHDLVSPAGFSDDDSPPASNLSSMQRAIVTIQKLRAKVESVEKSRTEPIAIVGMACRFPGDASTPEAFYKILDEGIDTISEVPPNRWRIEPDNPHSEADTRALRWGSFIKDVELFDASFFGISPREAESLDPQHRLLLEVSWEALERAGQLPEKLMGSKAGVFVGIWAPDYQLRVLARDPNTLDAYCFTGTILSTAAGRLSYTLGLQGPCMSIDTACSSSLTAIHLACQSLRSGESTMALAGGVNLMLVPTTSKLLSKTQALSPDGRCKTFDARANGYVRGEGCGMLVLKRLSDAERDGDTVLALVRGSAVNQDGRSTGLTAPNVLSQQSLLRQALESARLSPHDIAYLETHGTGTSLGDPIEVEAIKAVFGAPRERDAKCYLGALKSNIGHLEAAAGVAGVIKAVLAMQHEKIPGNLHFRSLNPRIDLQGTPLEIAHTAMPWKSGVRQRYAGVSSFGISGTNAHVIIEEAPRNLEEMLLEEGGSTFLLPISAKTHEALRAHAAAFRNMLISEPGTRLLDIVHTASARRSHYMHRLSVVGRSKEEMVEHLDAYLQGRTTSNLTESKSKPARAKIVFVFSGQGAQWLGMGRQLYASDASFRSVIDTCDNLMTSRLGWSILDEIDAPVTMSRIEETQIAQPLLFAVQVALVEMLRSWGISPDAMIGHSLGEIAAAHVAGILSLDEAIRLVAIRGRILQKATGMGKMISAHMTPDMAKTLLAGYEDRVSVAAINDPFSVVLSGTAAAVDDLVVRCEKQGITTRPLRVNYAFHSPQMDAFEHELVERLARIDTRRATLAMYSTVLGECVDGKELDVHYWGRNIRQTVDFAGAVFSAIRDGYQLFLEIGPHPNLVDRISQCLASKTADGLAVGTLERGQEDRLALLKAAGSLYTRGCVIEWSRVVQAGGRCVPLPTYPFQRERFWMEEIVPVVQKPQAFQPPATSRGKIVFVFPGQGSQWLGMGRQLLAEESIFREALEACDSAIQKEAGFSILAELAAEDMTSRLDEIDVIQPVLFAMEVALAALWRSRGVIPDCVVGHSMGEVAAAHVAGMLTLNDAVRIICRRSRLLKRMRGKGAMALVELPAAEAAQVIEEHKSHLSIAVSNGPRSTVLSGDSTTLDSVLQTLESKGIFCRRIKVDVASHSPQMESLRDELLAQLREIRPMPGLLRMQTTVDGRNASTTKLDAAYWWENLRNPVMFSAAVEALVDEGHSCFIELSPHPILIPAIEENEAVGSRGITTVASMRRNYNETESFARALELVVVQRQAAKASPARFAATEDRPPYGSTAHPFLGSRIDVPAAQSTIFWRQDFDFNAWSWFAGHQIDQRLIVPGSAIIETILAAARQALEVESIVIEDLTFVAPFVLDRNARQTIGVTLARSDDEHWTFTFSTRSEPNGKSEPTQWQIHATARVFRGKPHALESHPPNKAQNGKSENVASDEFTRRQQAIGITTDATFEAIVEITRSDRRSVARLQVPTGATCENVFIIHPTLLDAGLRAAILTTGETIPNQRTVVSRIERIESYGRVQNNAWSIGSSNPGNDHEARESKSLRIVDEPGHVFLSVDGVHTQSLKPDVKSFAHWLIDICWDELNRPSTGEHCAVGDQWLILCDSGGIGAEIGKRLVARGGNVRCVYRPTHVVGAANVETADIAQIHSLVEDTFANARAPRGVIHLWGLDTTLDAEQSIESLDSAQVWGCGAAIHLVQGLERLRTRDKPRLWLITRGTQYVAATPRPVAVEQASLWGLGRTIAIESADLRCARIDLDPIRHDHELATLLGEILSDDVEEEIAFRDERRFVSRLDSAKDPLPSAPPIVRSDATYVITGGLGGVGLFGADVLVSAGARHLVLVSRNGVVSPEQGNAVEALRALGATIDVTCADVSDLTQLSAVFAWIDEKMPPLRGILHAAGVLDDGLLTTQTPDRFRRVFAPKILGGWNLHQLTKTRNLDFLIFYSSVTSVLGAPGIGNYVAANAFLDALAHHRRGQKQVGTSINWGPLGDLGMAAKADRLGSTSRHGIRGFTSDEFDSLFMATLSEKRSQLVIADIDFRQWLEGYPQIAGSPRFQKMRAVSRGEASGNPNVRKRELLESLKRAAPRARISILETRIRQLLAAILRLDESRIDRTQPLRALGIDSLMGMELRNRLEAELGIRLSSTLIYAFPTVIAIAEHILGMVTAQLEQSPPAADKPQPIAPISTIEETGGTKAPTDDLLALFDQTMAEFEGK